MSQGLLLGLLLGLGSSRSHGVHRSGFTSNLGSLRSLRTKILSLSEHSVLLGDRGVGVELEHGADVLERVGLHHGSLHLPVGSSQHLPDGLALQQGGQVSVGHLGLRQVPPGLLGAGLAPSPVQTVQLLEGSLGPDAEPAHVTSRSELQQVEVVHLDAVHSRNVPEGLGQPLVVVVDDERASLLDSSPVPQLSLAGSHPPGGVHLGNISPGLAASQELHGLLGLLEALDLVRHNEGNLVDAGDDVTLGHDEGGHSGGGDGRAHGVPLLGHVDLPVPSPPGLGGSEHAATTAHVAESSLAGPRIERNVNDMLLCEIWRHVTTV